MSIPDISRRGFVAAAVTVGLGGFAHANEVASPLHDSDSNFPHQDPELVQAIVGASHTKLDRVKQLVTKCPPLARAAWDWGFGDWETALGAASHVGRRDIAEFLIAHGARPDMFTFAMLGDLATVKSIMTAQPEAYKIPGPHGITLLQHARNGGKAAEEVAAYLESLGDPVPPLPDQTLSAEQVEAYSGTYKLDDGVTFTIRESKGRLAFQRAEEALRYLTRRAEHEFFPVGASEVQMTFEVSDGKAISITGRKHISDFKALRVD